MKTKSKEIRGDESWLDFGCSNCGKSFGAFYDIMHIGSRDAVIICAKCEVKLKR